MNEKNEEENSKKLLPHKRDRNDRLYKTDDDKKKEAEKNKKEDKKKAEDKVGNKEKKEEDKKDNNKKEEEIRNVKKKEDKEDEDEKSKEKEKDEKEDHEIVLNINNDNIINNEENQSENCKCTQKCCLNCKSKMGCCLCLGKENKCQNCKLASRPPHRGGRRTYEDMKREEREMELSVQNNTTPLLHPQNIPQSVQRLYQFQNQNLFPNPNPFLSQNQFPFHPEDAFTTLSNTVLNLETQLNGINGNRRRSLFLSIAYSLIWIYCTVVSRQADGFQFGTTSSLYILIAGLFIMFFANIFQTRDCHKFIK